MTKRAIPTLDWLVKVVTERSNSVELLWNEL